MKQTAWWPSYPLPFLNPRVNSSNEDAADVHIDQDSYIKSVNALLRTHSVIGQILGARSDILCTAGARLHNQDGPSERPLCIA